MYETFVANSLAYHKQNLMTEEGSTMMNENIRNIEEGSTKSI
jgi:hypothetical protein